MEKVGGETPGEIRKVERKVEFRRVKSHREKALILLFSFALNFQLSRWRR